MNATVTQLDAFAEKNKIAQTAQVPKAPTVSTVDVNTLPDDVKKNLTGIDTMEMDQLILMVLNTPGSLYTADKIILSLWLNHQKSYGRTKVLSRLRALAAYGYVTKQPKTRGIYTLSTAGIEVLNGHETRQITKQLTDIDS